MGYDCRLANNRNTWKTLCSAIDPKECWKHYYGNNSYPVEEVCHYLCIGTKQEEAFFKTVAHLPFTTTDVLTFWHELLLQELSTKYNLKNYSLAHAQRIKKFYWLTESCHRKQHCMVLLFSKNVKHLPYLVNNLGYCGNKETRLLLLTLNVVYVIWLHTTWTF